MATTKSFWIMLLSATCLIFHIGLGNADADGAAQLRCKSFTTATLPKPIPQSDPLAIAQFDAISNEARSGWHAVLFFGDSLTQKWERPVWDRYFRPRGGLNAGVNGDRTEHLLWRLQQGNLDGPAPKAIVLLIGTNDIGRNRSPEVIAEGVRTILGVLRARLPAARILLLGILPRSQSADSRRRRQVGEVNALIQGCADRQHIFYADIGDALLDGRGQLTRAISPDGVHLSARGYAALATRLVIELDKLLTAK